MTQERFKSNLELRYKIIVSSIKPPCEQIVLFYQQQNLGRRFSTSKIHLTPPPTSCLGCSPFYDGDSVVVGLLFIVVPILGGFVFVPCFVMHYFVFSSFAIILMGKRDLVVLFYLSFCCLVTIIALWLFLMVPWVGLQYLIVVHVFPGHTHFLFILITAVMMVNSNKLHFVLKGGVKTQRGGFSI